MCDVTAVTHVTVQEKRPRRCRAIFNAPQHCEYCCCCSVRPRSVVHDDGVVLFLSLGNHVKDDMQATAKPNLPVARGFLGVFLRCAAFLNLLWNLKCSLPTFAKEGYGDGGLGVGSRSGTPEVCIQNEGKLCPGDSEKMRRGRA